MYKTNKLYDKSYLFPPRYANGIAKLYPQIATFITPSNLFSNIRYASSISLNAKRCVMSGVVSILPCSIKLNTSSQSHPSTPPVLNVRFLPYISSNRKIIKIVMINYKLILFIITIFYYKLSKEFINSNVTIPNNLFNSSIKISSLLLGIKLNVISTISP